MNENIEGAEIVGRMVALDAGFAIVCPDCEKKYAGFKEIFERAPYIYRVNIGQYSQHCGLCHKLLVPPNTPFWCELFNPVFAALDRKEKQERQNRSSGLRHEPREAKRS